MTTSIEEDLQARVEASTALRDLAHAFVTFNAPIELIREARDWATEQVQRWSNGTRRDRIALMRSAHEAAVAEGREVVGLMRGGAGFEDRAVAGRANPTGIDIAQTAIGDICSAIVTFRKANEGPPGRAHGGIVSAVFDDVTGYVIGYMQKPAFTGELTVRLVAPVPLDTPLVFRTWLDSESGRKLYIHGEALDGERVVATCKATYITVDSLLFGGPAPQG